MELDIRFNSRSQKGYEFQNTEKFIHFINEQLKYWEPFLNEFDLTKVANQPISSARNLKNLLTEISALEKALDNQATQEQQKQTAKMHFSNSVRTNMGFWLHSEDLLTSPYIDCYRRFGANVAQHFIGYATGTEAISKQITPDTLNAYIFLYEYRNSSIDYIIRLESEKKSIQETLQNLRINCKDIEDLFDNQNQQIESLKESASNDFQRLFHDNSSEHSQNQIRFTNEFDEFIADSTKKIESLENLYQEKLRLAEPAQYWKKSAEKYAKQGYTFMAILVLWIVCGFVYLGTFFNNWLQGQTHHLNLTTLEGAVIFGTVVTIYTLLAKTISKLTFSSMHLMRDSEEREQLTYLYLSLTKENELDKTSRDIILQSLFSPEFR